MEVSNRRMTEEKKTRLAPTVAGRVQTPYHLEGSLLMVSKVTNRHMFLALKFQIVFYLYNSKIMYKNNAAKLSVSPSVTLRHFVPGTSHLQVGTDQ